MRNSEPNPSCPVGFGIRPTPRQGYDGVEDTMRKRLAGTTIADVLRDVRAQERAQRSSRPRQAPRRPDCYDPGCHRKGFNQSLESGPS
ncbi:hypothetical protein ABZV34_34970 [Streptomyces sp. NPDC005195]|uniref:hypothetical protein n=1 Tax=Streptomyces sp. NPDC005195 TaxID=3154561 RepID=UPI0033A1E165